MAMTQERENDIKSRIETISKYYDYKRNSYEEKYNLGYYTHIHTGFYEPRRFPFLFQDETDIQTLGIKRIKYFLFVGQQNLTNYACNNFSNGEFQKVLDCGCGHGGTSIYLAQNYNIGVVGITVSRQEVLEAKRFVRMARLQHLADIRLMNIFESNFADAEFDGGIDIDSFCHMGDLERLFSILWRIMREGGKIVICDYFINKATNDFKGIFDSYWRADVSTLQQLLEASCGKGFVIRNVKDMTTSQIPFWKLSIAYTKILLGSKKIESDQREKQRLTESLRYHQDLVQAFLNGDMYYYGLVLEKRV